MTTLALSNGAFVVTDGASSITLNTGGRRATDWEAGRNDQVLGVRDATASEDGAYVILVSTTSRSGAVTYTEFLVSATGVVERRGEALTVAEVGDIDASYTALGTGASLSSLIDMTLVDVATARGLAGIDLGVAQGRYTIIDTNGPVQGNVNLVDSRGNEWEVPGGTEIIGVREKGEGYALLLEETDRRGNISYSEVDISATGEVARRPINLTEAEKAALEPAYDITLTAPPPEMLGLDSPGGVTDIGTITYPETGQVQYVIDTDGNGTAATILIKDNRGDDWSPGRDTIVAVRDLPGDTGFEVLLRDDRGAISKLFIAQDGTADRSPVLLRGYDLVRESIRFDSELTEDGFNATKIDKVAAVINDPETVRADAGKIAAIVSEGGGLFVQAGATAPAAGADVDRLWDNGANASTVPLLLTEDGSGWAPTNAAAGATMIGARELADSAFSVLSLRVSDTGRFSYREQDFDANGEAVGRDRAVDAVALEGLYLQDFNGDNVIDIRQYDLQDDFVTDLSALELNGVTVQMTAAQAEALSFGGEGRVEVFQIPEGGLTLEGVPADVEIAPQIGAGEVVRVRRADDGSDDDVSITFHTSLWNAEAEALADDVIVLGTGEFNIRDGHPIPADAGQRSFGRITTDDLTISGSGEDVTFITGNARIASATADYNWGADNPFDGLTISDLTFVYDATGTTSNGYLMQWETGINAVGPDGLTLKNVTFTGTLNGNGPEGTRYPYSAMWGTDNLMFDNITVEIQGVQRLPEEERLKDEVPLVSGTFLTFYGHNNTVTGSQFTGLYEGAINTGNDGLYDNSALAGWFDSSDVTVTDNFFASSVGTSSGFAVSLYNVDATVTGNTFELGAGLRLDNLGRNNGPTEVVDRVDILVENNTFAYSDEFHAIRVNGYVDKEQEVDYDLSEVGGSGNRFVGSSGAPIDNRFTADNKVVTFTDSTVNGRLFENLMVGGLGSDTITAEDAGDELLYGGRSSEELVSDTFFFTEATIGNDVIADFEGDGVEGGDMIWLAYNGLTFDALNIAVANGNSVITADNFDGSITVLGVTQLAADDFMFGLV